MSVEKRAEGTVVTFLGGMQEAYVPLPFILSHRFLPLSISPLLSSSSSPPPPLLLLSCHFVYLPLFSSLSSPQKLHFVLGKETNSIPVAQPPVSSARKWQDLSPKHGLVPFFFLFFFRSRDVLCMCTECVVLFEIQLENVACVFFVNTHISQYFPQKGPSPSVKKRRRCGLAWGNMCCTSNT